eukprot:350296-Chlamydomonas_euryale.AAC.2
MKETLKNSWDLARCKEHSSNNNSNRNSNNNSNGNSNNNNNNNTNNCPRTASSRCLTCARSITVVKHACAPRCAYHTLYCGVMPVENLGLSAICTTLGSALGVKNSMSARLSAVPCSAKVK